MGSIGAPRVSVNMPVYDAETYLDAAIRSIRDQTFSDFELIAIDDGSKDGSLAILERHERMDPRIRVITRENRGISRTRNEALFESQGEYVAVMDADDISLPQRFEEQVAFLDANPECIAVGTRVLLIDSSGAPIREMSEETDHDRIDQAHLSGHGGAITNPSAMMRRAPLIAIGGYRQELEAAEDVDVFLRLAEIGRVANLPTLLHQYRQHLSSFCYTHRKHAARDLRCVLRDAYERRNLTIPEKLGRSSVDLHVCAHYRRWAWWALNAGHHGTARKYAWFALRRCPWSLESWRAFYCTVRGY